MRVTPILVAAAAAALSTAAAAQDAARVAPAAQPQAARIVMICDADPATERAFRREHGEAPRFMTAEDLQTARERGERWETPRCITADEHRKLTQQARAER